MYSEKQIKEMSLKAINQDTSIIKYLYVASGSCTDSKSNEYNIVITFLSNAEVYLEEGAIAGGRMIPLDVNLYTEEENLYDLIPYAINDDFAIVVSDADFQTIYSITIDSLNLDSLTKIM